MTFFSESILLLDTFSSLDFKNKFSNFGNYEDAIISENNFLFHSAISPILNMGLLTPDEVIKKALEFSKLRAREIMIPRAEIVSVDRYVTPSKLKEIFINTGISKILVHHEIIDNIVGYIIILHMFKDFKKLWINLFISLFSRFYWLVYGI